MLPSALAAGAAGDPKLTEAAWRAAGAELAAMGINIDFAPVADVLATRSTVIGSRSYGADPKQAAAQVGGAVRGLQAAGVAATLKHFPGHGHSADDSHKDLPVLTQSAAALQSGAWPPFTAGIDAGAMAVMSGHLDAQRDRPGDPGDLLPQAAHRRAARPARLQGRGDHRRDEHAAGEALGARRGGRPGAATPATT